MIGKNAAMLSCKKITKNYIKLLIKLKNKLIKNFFIIVVKLKI